MADNKLVYSTNDDLATIDTTSGNLFSIKDIIIEGNTQTKSYIILRELSFNLNDRYTLQTLVKKFRDAKKQLMNSGLFSAVVVSLKSLQGRDAFVKIDVKERWYVYPIPFVRIVDRSFGEWVKEKNMSMDRVNYGIKLYHSNATGRKDKLYVYLMNGYTKQIVLTYEGLVLDKNLHWSSNMGVASGKNRQLNYITAGNKQLTYKNDDRFVHSFFRTYFELSYRPAINTKHTFGIGYNTETFPDTVLSINPYFSPKQQKTIRFPQFYYTLSYFNFDYIPYPTQGYAAELSLRKKGFNDQQMNLWQITAKGSGVWPLSEKYFFNLRLAGALKLPLKQPYVNQQLLGFNDMIMQGYEYYVVDGVAGGYAKASFSRELINTAIHVPSERIKRLNNIPVRLYAKVYGNAGYVYNPQPGSNKLNNRLLYSGGVGLDIVTFYDFIIKLEWSFNQLGQNDIYLHRKDYF
jgi:outer membrane protein assembly factor BamA